MRESLSRVNLLIGDRAMNKLQSSHIVVVGLGGVGSVTADALARTGVGKLTLIDYDTVARSNINRQIFATEKTVGMLKTQALKDGIKDINPDAKVNILSEKITERTVDNILKLNPDIIVDAVDDIPIKIALIKGAQARKIKIVSSMGAALRIDPTMVRIAQLRKTKTDPVAAKMRKSLPNNKVLVVYSEEKPYKVGTRDQFGSAMTSTGTFGLFLAHAAMYSIAGAELEWKAEEFKKQNLY